MDATKDEKTKKTAQIITGILMLVFILWVVNTCDNIMNPEPKAPVPLHIQSKQHTKLEAHIRTQIEVEKYLKSPSTAEYPMGKEDYVIKQNDTTFVVSSYVDAKNSFGVPLRYNFNAVVLYTPDNIGHVTLISLEQQ